MVRPSAEKDAESTPEPEHLFDQTNGVLGTDDSGSRDSNEQAVERAYGAALGATGVAGWGM